MNKTEDAMAALEAKLNTDTDALVSSILTNGNTQDFIEQLEKFEQKKTEDISQMCADNSKTFSNSIEGAQQLGEQAATLKKNISQIATTIVQKISTYESRLSQVVDLQNRLKQIDDQIYVVSEVEYLFQTIENINDELDAGHFYVAVVKILEFADYDSHAANLSAINGMQKDVQAVLEYCSSCVEEKTRQWLIDIKARSIEIGNAILFDDATKGLDYSPVYEAFMVKKQLGLLESFRNFYTKRRIRQFENARDAPFASESKMDRVRYLLSITAGFFAIEAHIAGDGFTIFTQSELDDLWKRTLDFLRTEFATIVSPNSIEDMIQLAKYVNLFSEKMSVYSLSATALRAATINQSSTFRSRIARSTSVSVNTIVNQCTGSMMVVKSAEDLVLLKKYRLIENDPTSFPTELDFAESLPKGLAEIEATLQKWITFTSDITDRGVVELYDSLFTSFTNSIKSLGLSQTAIPQVIFSMATIIALKRSLSYFDFMVASAMQTADRENTEKLLKPINAAIIDLKNHMQKVYIEFLNEMLDSSCLNEMKTGPTPHWFMDNIIMYFDAFIALMRPILPTTIYQSIVENIGQVIRDRFCKLIISSSRVEWTPDLIHNCAQNINYLANWPTLISVPSAKAQLNGLVTMLNLMTSQQLIVVTSDPQYISTKRDMPFDVMLAILQRYTPTTKQTNIYVIPKNLQSALLQKLNHSIHK